MIMIMIMIISLSFFPASVLLIYFSNRLVVSDLFIELSYLICEGNNTKDKGGKDDDLHYFKLYKYGMDVFVFVYRIRISASMVIRRNSKRNRR